jgi:hypothetical protein
MKNKIDIISSNLTTYTDGEYTQDGALIEKTIKDQYLHAEILSILQTILVNEKIYPILFGSGVLGYIRSNSFLSWVPGLTFIVKHEEIDGKTDKLMKILSPLFDKSKYIPFYKSTDTQMITVWLKYLAVEIQVYRLVGKNRERHLRSNIIKTIPAKFMDNIKQINIYDQVFYIPSDTRNFLTHLYGDWKTVIKTRSQNCKTKTFRQTAKYRKSKGISK